MNIYVIRGLSYKGSKYQTNVLASYFAGVVSGVQMSQTVTMQCNVIRLHTEKLLMPLRSGNGGESFNIIIYYLHFKSHKIMSYYGEMIMLL